MKTALVTGAYGFLGRYVSQRLSTDGYYVTGIGHGSWTREEWQAWGVDEWHQCDVNLDSLLSFGGSPNLIVHCAGSGSVGYSITNPLQDYRRTVDTCINALEFARGLKSLERFVLPSSAGVYGVCEELPIRVTSSTNPVSPYGVHKVMAEQLCGSYARHFSVPVSIVRLFSVYGLGLRKQLLWDASRKLCRGIATFSGTGEETRDWIHVEDAANLLLIAALARDNDYIVLNGGCGQEVSVRAIVELLSKCIFKGAKHAPSIEFDGTVRIGDPQRYLADIEEARELGWSPTRSIEIGIEEYVGWALREKV